MGKCVCEGERQGGREGGRDGDSDWSIFSLVVTSAEHLFQALLKASSFQFPKSDTFLYQGDTSLMFTFFKLVTHLRIPSSLLIQSAQEQSDLYISVHCYDTIDTHHLSTLSNTFFARIQPTAKPYVFTEHCPYILFTYIQYTNLFCLSSNASQFHDPCFEPSYMVCMEFLFVLYILCVCLGSSGISGFPNHEWIWPNTEVIWK